MAPTADPQFNPSGTIASPAADAGARPVRRSLLGDNPMQTVLGAAVVALLIFSLTSNRNRIDRLEDTVVAGFAAQDAKIQQMDAGIQQLDSKIHQIDLKLTALVAGLNMTAEVDAAIEGSLLRPDTADGSP